MTHYEIELEEHGKPLSRFKVFGENGIRRPAHFTTAKAAIEATRIIRMLRTDNVLIATHVIQVTEPNRVN